MNERLCIKEPVKLTSVADILNGAWFDLEDMKFSQDSRELIIRFRREAPHRVARLASVSSATGSGPELVLVIKDVLEYEVRDTEKVGIYDLNRLKYDAATNCIELRGGIPLLIRIRVSRFEVCLEQTGRTIQHLAR